MLVLNIFVIDVGPSHPLDNSSRWSGIRYRREPRFADAFRRRTFLTAELILRVFGVSGDSVGELPQRRGERRRKQPLSIS